MLQGKANANFFFNICHLEYVVSFVLLVGSCSEEAGQFTSSIIFAVDTHDMVLRFNHAPTSGYEADVGTKTTLRIVNSQVVSKPSFNFMTSSLYQNVILLAWDPSNYSSTLQQVCLMSDGYHSAMGILHYIILGFHSICVSHYTGILQCFYITLHSDFTVFVCHVILGFQDHHACYHLV
jgi:hypothetical protein